MDFDDLDEAEDIIINNQPKTGTVLPLMKRGHRTPSRARLPQLIRSKLPPAEPAKARAPKLRLLCTMGAGDNVCQEWCFMEHDAPECLDMMTQEPPGHGLRVEEPISTTLQAMGDDAFEAFREAMDTGPFVLLGHSIGCLTAAYVAERAKRELNAQPLLAIMIERGAPHIPAFSDYGLDMLRNDPVRFMKIRDPSTAKAFDIPTLGQQALRMWSNDLLLENDTRPVGWYKFPCPIRVLRCTTIPKAEFTAEQLEQLRGHFEIHSERDFFGHFGQEWCEAWGEWTDHNKGATVEVCEGCNHMSIKSDAAVRRRIWSELTAIVEAF